MAKKKTKIVATIGPASSTPELIQELIESGVDVFRFNMKHADIAWHEEMIERVQNVADKMGVLIGVMIDLQGPEIRIKLNGEIKVEPGMVIEFVKDVGDRPGVIGVKHDSFFKAMEVGDKFSIDDGFVAFEVTKLGEENTFLAEAKDDGVIGNNKGLNLVGKNLEVPSLIDDDIKKLDLATRKEIDFVALSFVRSRNDILALKEVMKRMKINAGIVSKVESKMGVDNIDEIIRESDAVMVARGDLGIEVPIEQLTYHQKEMVRKCRIAKTPVIVATQMLESMIVKPAPTRAEATDVANAIFDGTDAVMLSGETAGGKFPVKAVKAMAKIAKFNEGVAKVPPVDREMTGDAELVINAASMIAQKSNGGEEMEVDYIVAVTESGSTARTISSYRPKAPIIALTPSDKTAEKLKMSYGVTPIVYELPNKGEFIRPDEILKKLKDAGTVKKGELILVIYGQRKADPGMTNSIVLLHVD